MICFDEGMRRCYLGVQCSTHRVLAADVIAEVFDELLLELLQVERCQFGAGSTLESRSVVDNLEAVKEAKTQLNHKSEDKKPPARSSTLRSPSLCLYAILKPSATSQNNLLLFRPLR